MGKKQWHENLKITPPLEMPLEPKSQRPNDSTVADVEETRRLLIGAMLTQANCTSQFANLLALAALSNSATPKMVGALSFALSEMVNLTTNMCDQLRTLTSTLMHSRQITPSDQATFEMVSSICQGLADIVDDFDL